MESWAPQPPVKVKEPNLEIAAEREEKIARLKGLREEAEVLKRAFKEENGFDIDQINVSDKEIKNAEDFLARMDTASPEEREGDVYKNSVASNQTYLEYAKKVLAIRPELDKIKNAIEDMRK